MMRFSEYVGGRVDAFGAMPMPYGSTWNAMRVPLIDVLIELAGEKPKAEQPHALAWSKTRAGERVSAVCAECATFDEAPTLPKIRATWRMLFPPLSAAKDCPYCDGDNWVSQEGPFGLTAAQPCNHTGQVNESLGLVMTSRQMARYAQEMAAAEKRGLSWRESDALKRHATPKTEFVGGEK